MYRISLFCKKHQKVQETHLQIFQAHWAMVVEVTWVEALSLCWVAALTLFFEGQSTELLKIGFTKP